MYTHTSRTGRSQLTLYVTMAFLAIHILFIAVPSVRYNIDNLYYQSLLFSQENTQIRTRTPSDVASSLRQSDAYRYSHSSNVDCRIRSLVNYPDGSFLVPSMLIQGDSRGCRAIVSLGAQPVILPITEFVSSVSVSTLDDMTLQFRRNSSIWGPVYVQKAGFYQFITYTRCIGPQPCQMRITANETSETYDFHDTNTLKSKSFRLHAGINWIELSYINDAVINGQDRNLHLVSAQVVPYGD